MPVPSTATLLDQFRDYLLVELRLSKQTADTYLRECMAADADARESGLSLAELNTAQLVDYLIRRNW